MNQQEKTLARIFFQNKVFKSEGQQFEDLFCDIMSYADRNFKRIKAWGNLGDRKNDGYIENKGIFYQVFAPEDIRKAYPEIVNKIQRDFDGLKEAWPNIREFYFVVNDKYKGVHPESEQTIKTLKNSYALEESGIITADNLERILFELEENQINTIVGFLPDIEKIVNLDYHVLNEVIGFIMKLPIPLVKGEIKFPEWDEKIRINNLSEYSKHLLNHGSQTVGSLDKFLANNSFLAEELQSHITGVYQQIKKAWSDFEVSGDHIFWELINECSPKNENPYQNAVVVIMAKYFESCDIFEEK